MVTVWDTICKHPEVERQMRAHYESKGQYQIRGIFAEWIENQMMSQKIDTAAQQEHYANKFCEDLDGKLIQIINAGNDEAKVKWTEIYSRKKLCSPLEYYNHLRKGIQQEFQYISQLGVPSNMINSISSQGYSNGIPDPSDAVRKVIYEISDYGKQLQLFTNEIEEFHSTLNNLLIQSPNVLHSTPQILNESQQMINDKIQTFNNYFTMYQSFKSVVIDEHLKRWQRNQALAGNGAPFRDNLDDIQACIENLLPISTILIDIYKSLRIIISKLCLDERYIHELDQVSIIIEKIKQYIILSAFIVEKQPPQVMKTNTRFAATVRWLIGPQLDIYRNNPQVECIILSENQAQRFYETRHQMEPRPGSSGEIQNNIGNMEYNPQNSNRHFAVHFRNMQLKKIKRTEKKGTESVMDEKFALLFYTTVDFHNNGHIHSGPHYKITAWTLSLPVVVIVHGNQEPQSWATITWDNAFSDIIRNPFQVPERVNWSDLSKALNTKFSSNTGRQLTPENLNFLYEKIFWHNETNTDSKYVTWPQFCKEPLKDRSFTFWDWFYHTMKLTKDHILKPWQAGCINGFISKRNATEILRQCPEGTFLIRFSDSELGGVTIGVKNNGDTLMLAPWVARDLNVLSLPDRISDLSTLQYLYQGPSSYIPKDEAFGQFYSPRRESEVVAPDGYVRNQIRVSIPIIEKQNTPQHTMQSPHSRDIDMNPPSKNLTSQASLISDT
ncbi:signal transducer and transcription activator isoform X3 [Condylostylus longicornis]|uniref:signal transducer and transcription activator isoform X3 n=1 Tax=Condylostylus longicornis TaxID=2530218 RepID=UPI00244DDDA2|nr:signal transducer and transcription activator isoform X3 [Condylostylus longicornis]